MTEKGNLASAVLGGGCFWCIEAVFQRIDGVARVESGYAGGHVANPSYEQVCGKNTGHAEVVRVFFDPDKVSFSEILDVFWKAHDPTTLNRQGPDAGPQYRSIILYSDDAQKNEAELSKASAQENFKDPIVTEIAPLKEFWVAEANHQDYYNRNKMMPYCMLMITPKIKKLGI